MEKAVRLLPLVREGKLPKLLAAGMCSHTPKLSPEAQPADPDPETKPGLHEQTEGQCRLLLVFKMKSYMNTVIAD